MCKRSSPKTIQQGQWPGCCTIITSPYLDFPNASCRTREWNSVEKSLQPCAVYWVSKRSVQPRTTNRPMGQLREYTTLQHMIGKLDPEKRKKWPALIGSIIIPYNSTRSLVTRYSRTIFCLGIGPGHLLTYCFQHAGHKC